MKAVYIEDFGGVENLEVREVDDPAPPSGGEVRVRVVASALNRADILQRKGLYPAPVGYPERIPGLEFAGEVVDVGDGSRRFSKGARVFGITAGGAHAEMIVTHEDLLTEIPDGLDFNSAAAIPEAFITAHDAVIVQGGLVPGETLLVHAVGSGVGLAALQLAKALGSKVYGTSRSSDKLVRCAELGLEAGLLVGDDQKFAAAVQNLTEGKGADVILDLVGAKYLSENIDSIGVKGRILFVGVTGGAKAELDLGTVLRKRVKMIGTVLRSRTLEEKADVTRRFSEDVVPLIATGAVRANVDKVFPVGMIRTAHEYLESNASFGKVVIEF